MSEATGIEAEVCQDIAERQQKGIAKYGTTVADNPLSLTEWIEHAYQESLDRMIYFKRARVEAENLIVQLAERDERIAELELAIELARNHTVETGGSFRQWFAEVREILGAALTRATSSKIAGGWLPIEREQMEWLDANCFDLRCENVPSSGDDADIIWIVYSHHMSKPALRAEGYGKTASKAVADAMLPKGDPKRWDYVPPEYDLPLPPESSEVER